MIADQHSQQLLERLANKIFGSDFSIPLSKLGGKDDYVDGKRFGKFLKLPQDISGMLTNGKLGGGGLQSFLGSYDFDYQVIMESPKARSFTVAYAAYSDTGTASLLHASPYIRDVSPGHAFRVSPRSSTVR